MSTTFAENDTPTGEIEAANDDDVPNGPIVKAATTKDTAKAVAVKAAASTPAVKDPIAKDAASTAILMALADDGTMQPVATVAEAARVAVPADAPPDEVRATPPKPRRRAVADLLACFAYLMIAVWVTSKLWPIGGHPVSAVDANDQAFFEWMLSHGARVATHFDSPLFTDRINAPVGVNLMANTSILALSIPLAPITLWLGPAVSYALLITLGLAGTASAWYYVLSRHVVASRSAAIVGGAIAGLGPGIIAHANGHPNIVAQFLVPFIVWRTVKLREPGRWLRNGAALGLLVVLQVFINEEMLFIVALSIAIMMTAYAAARRREVKAQIRPFAAGLAAAALLAGPLLAYPLWRQFFGPAAYRGLNPAVQAFGADALSFSSFGSRTLVGDFTNNVHLASSAAEQNSFFGWPLLITFAIALFWLRRNAFARALGITALLLAILSLGAKVEYQGAYTHIAAPWALVKDLPLFDSVVPTRLALFILPIIAVVIAMAHDRVLSTMSKTAAGYASSRPRAPQARLAWCVLVGVSLIAAFPTPVPTVPSMPTPAFFSQGIWETYAAPDETVVPVPLPQAGAVTSMFWAADTGLELRLPAGYFLGPDPAHHDMATFGAPPRRTTLLLDKVIASNKRAVVKSADRKAALADLRYWHAAVVVQLPSGPADHALRQTLSDLLGFKPKFAGGVWVWDVRRLVGERPALSG